MSKPDRQHHFLAGTGLVIYCFAAMIVIIYYSYTRYDADDPAIGSDPDPGVGITAAIRDLEDSGAYASVPTRNEARTDSDRVAPAFPDLETVDVGFYVNHIALPVEPVNQTFISDFYLWMSWTTSDLVDGDEPGLRFEFMNSISPPHTSYETSAEDRCVVLDPDGKRRVGISCSEHARNASGDPSPLYRYYSVHRVRGRFLYNPVLRRYPLDQQTFPINLELSVAPVDEYRFAPDDNSAIPSRRAYNGWNFSAARLVTKDSVYHTNFGIPSASGRHLAYSRAALSMTFARDVFPYMFKTLIPLCIILFTVSLVFIIKPDDLLGRSSICSAAFFTATALHITASSALPNVGYATVMDKLFINAYVHISVATLVVVISNRISERSLPTARVLNAATAVIYPLTLMAGFYASANL